MSGHRRSRTPPAPSADGEGAARHRDLLGREARGRGTRDDVAGGGVEVALVAGADDLPTLDGPDGAALVGTHRVERLEGARGRMGDDGLAVGEDLAAAN